MGFGSSYSLIYVDCLDWVKTSLVKRIIRGILGIAIVACVFIGFRYVPSHDNPTRFFFLYALPAMSLSFFTFGIYPIICLKIGLVRQYAKPMTHYLGESTIESGSATVKGKGLPLEQFYEAVEENATAEEEMTMRETSNLI
jgi:hypothetical protein